MKIFQQYGILLLLLLALAGCRGKQPKRMPDTLPDVRGTISEITAGQEKTEMLVLHVASVEGLEVPAKQASITVDKSTLMEDTKGEAVQREQLRKGLTVAAWLEGSPLKGDSISATAKAIRVEN
ncbi:hypothetical protein [Pontibacter liquoris]|uniref:hypothetical protein n=1 Tax=Pontibacter liquoris TaxID=2905677 RepID=UPI001FA74C51|nr:hypothetical protein [Pontibacter liquoris]